jgi:PAS domain S-box-containing protein
MQEDKPTFSLRWKIVLIACVTAGLSALLIAALSYYSMRGIARDKAIEHLAHETNVAALRVGALYTQMKNDLFAISSTAAVSSIITALRNGGVAPEDGATLDNLRARLSSAFAMVMKGRHHYTQMRYIGIADNGRELVRVNRAADGTPQVVQLEQLQGVAGETYFKESLRVPAGAYYVSRVAYNRERGVTDPTYTPTMRMLLPVFDQAGERFGMIAISANYELLMNEALPYLPQGYDIYVSDGSGDYIHRNAQGRIARMEVSGAYRATPPKFIEHFVAGRLADEQFSTADQIGYCRRLNVADDQRHGWVGVFFLMPRAHLAEDANSLIRQNLLIAAAITFAAGMLAAFLADLHTWPIRRITAAIQAFGGGRGVDVDLPVDAADEVGVMARAFQKLVENLQLSQERNAALSLQLDTFILSSVDGIVMIDERGIIEEINPAALGIFGYQRDEMVGRNVSMVMPSAIAARHDEYLSEYLRTGRQSFIGTIREVEGRRKDGTLVPLSISVTEMLLADKRRIFGGIIRDMSTMHEAQRSIELYTAELERSNHELDQFAYIASHDLKAPLRVIDNASRWLEEDLNDKLTDEDRANMTLLRGRAQRMEKLLDDLLEYSRIGKVQDGRYRESVSLAKLIDDVVFLLEPPSSMAVVAPPGFAAIGVYRMPLQRVFFNLIDNAIKHHDRGSGKIQLNAEDHGDYYLFTVQDDGPGIPDAYNEEIFEMFRTLKPRDQVEGSGMGLAFVKKTVESVGGAISVASAGERGTVFSFSWPKPKANQNVQSAERAA